MTKRAAPSPAIEWHAAPIPTATGVRELGILPPLPPLAALIADLRPTWFHVAPGSVLHDIEQQVVTHVGGWISPRHFLSPHLQLNAPLRGWHTDQDGGNQDMICCIVADDSTTPGTVFRDGTTHANRLYWIRRGTVHRSPESSAPRLMLRWDVDDAITAALSADDKTRSAITGY